MERQYDCHKDDWLASLDLSQTGLALFCHVYDAILVRKQTACVRFAGHKTASNVRLIVTTSLEIGLQFEDGWCGQEEEKGSQT